MKLVVDSNRLIAALIKDSTTRHILFNKKFEFVAPSYILSEINKYENYIIRKAKITEDEFDILISILFESIKIIPSLKYTKFIKKFIKDEKDVSYLAVCFAVGAKGIWTHDAHFKEQDKFMIYTNNDLLDFVDF